MNIYGCYPIFEKSGWQQSAFVRPLANGDSIHEYDFIMV